eukprot:TRINITY_DN3697_c0_g3_i2.p1 TRINITY_DN3697_c0_g3~~TRINITY_DN3697_c0_g3_i2.p1  ORF type:complete len:665 (+),score=129.87 TRINITY_DN3697_c0_g3_i2:117-2111(+)
MRVAGNEVVDVVYRGTRSVVFRALQQYPGQEETHRVILKMRVPPDENSPNAQRELTASNQRTRHEFSVGRKLKNCSHVVKFLDIAHEGQSLVIVMEDLGAVGLHTLLPAPWPEQPRVEQPLASQKLQAEPVPISALRKFGLVWVLRVMIQMVKGLAFMHSHGISHRDIKPANIVIAGNDRGELTPMSASNPWLRVYYIDFDLSTAPDDDLACDIPGNASTFFGTQEEFNAATAAADAAKLGSKLVGTLHYMSPEQTGRLDRAADYRTDFYSFGVMMYQMSLGQLPFENIYGMSDLVFAHLARNAVSPAEVDPCAVPDALSRVIMRLMAKDPEDRYQSAAGLLADLRKCLTAVRGGVAPLALSFPLGEEDCPRRGECYIRERLSRRAASVTALPQRLYGREKELSLLHAALRAVAITGEFRFVLVSGSSGVGKTSLVNELTGVVSRMKGEFLYGKCRQQDSVYGPFVRAFRSFARHLLASATSEELHRWSLRTLSALGDRAQLIGALIPELQIVFGDLKQQQPPSDTGTSAPQFHAAFTEFVQLLTTACHPLVLFLDDLHWADSGTIDLLQALVETSDCLPCGQGQRPHLNMLLVISSDQAVTTKVAVSAAKEVPTAVAATAEHAPIPPTVTQAATHILSLGALPLSPVCQMLAGMNRSRKEVFF